MASGLSDDSLRLLYLDWCSAQVARRFLELSLDEVWLRSHSAIPPGIPSGRSSAEAVASEVGSSLVAVERIPGYLEIVRRTALSLAEELNLPSFPEWKEEYLRSPERFEREIVGG